jgi:peptide/nickel transport system substrate-binding protein
MGHLSETMVRPVTETGEWVPYLAQSYELLDNNMDVRITLRKDARFHNGDPVTSQDVKFSWQQYLDKKNASVYARYFRRIKDIEIVDDHNLIIRCKRPSTDWMRLMQTFHVGSKKYFDKVGEEQFHKEDRARGLRGAHASPGVQKTGHQGYPR